MIEYLIRFLTLLCQVHCIERGAKQGCLVRELLRVSLQLSLNQLLLMSDLERVVVKLALFQPPR
jgi:hypothetical protein